MVAVLESSSMINQSSRTLWKYFHRREFLSIVGIHFPSTVELTACRSDSLALCGATSIVIWKTSTRTNTPGNASSQSRDADLPREERLGELFLEVLSSTVNGFDYYSHKVAEAYMAVGHPLYSY